MLARCAAGGPGLDDRGRCDGDVIGGRRAAERQPQRATGALVGDAHRRQNVRRLHCPAGTRRGRAGAHACFVEEVQQRLVLDAVDAHMRRAGDLVGAVDGLVDVVELGAQPSTSESRSSATLMFSAARSLSVARNAAAMAMIPATLWVPLRRSRS